jgi:hypothetical protein
MENGLSASYVSEKIVNALVGGCVPIYYGDKHIFDIFNRDAFVWWDPNAPDKALAQVDWPA